MTQDPDEVSFTEKQQKLLTVFERTPNTDIRITAMYYCLYGVPTDTVVPVRDMQQKLAPILQRINSKLYGMRIEPGQLKQTYRLNTNHTV